MRKYIIILVVALAQVAQVAQADLLDDLIGRKAFEPKRLTEAQQDSILNGVEPQKYSLEMRETQSIWRHSREGKCYICETERNREWLMTDTLVRDAVMSPNSRYVAYGRGNNLWLYKVDFKTEIPVTESPMPIYNGVTDWLYEEEFGVTNLIAFSPDNKYIAFVRLDDREVPMCEFGPYPKAGDPNPKASVWVYDIFYKSLKQVNLGAAGEQEHYIPRLSWNKAAETKKGSKSEEPTLVVTWINRDQNEMREFGVNPKTMVCTLQNTEKNSTGWVDIEKSSVNGKEESVKSSVENVWAETVSRRYSADGKRYIECRESVQQPPVYTLCKVESVKNKAGNGKVIRVLEDNAELKARWDSLQLPEKEFFSFVSERGDTLCGWRLVPNTGAVRDENGKIVGQDCMLRRFPVVMTQYSGPESRRVVNKWSKRFEYYLAHEGYMVVCVDPRGTGGRDKQWLEQTYMQLGKKEAEDQIATAHYLASLPDVDVENISMIGWSYGGFCVIRTLEEQGIRQQTRNEAALIRRGVAIAPVTDWRLYDSAYTERYMRRPQVNEDGYEAADLSTMAKFLTGDLLLVHGLKDDNVHPEHSLKLTRALIEEGKYFEMMFYPEDNHFLRHGADLRDVHLRLLRFIK